MARPALKLRKYEREPSPRAHRTSARFSAVHPKGSSTTLLSTRDAKPAKDVLNKPKIKQTVSAAGIFKKAKVISREKRQSRRQSTPKPDLINEFKGRAAS